MNNLPKNSKFIYKKINYLLKSVNLSFELIVGLKIKKIYRLLKKIAKIIENFNLPKQELKQMAILISEGKFQKRKVTNKIIKLIFKFSQVFKKNIIYIKYLKNWIFFQDKFFDKKQIIRC